jgi:hypothetical protein
MNSHQSNNTRTIAEISGTPGQVWGNVAIPASGKTTMKIVGDVLQSNTTSAYQLEKKLIYTRIQNIDSVELVEGRMWWLLTIGIFTSIYLIGIAFIIAFFVYKRNWIVVHTNGSNLILFYKKTENAQDFCKNILAISRQLNTPMLPQQNMGNGSQPLPSAAQ